MIIIYHHYQQQQHHHDDHVEEAAACAMLNLFICISAYTDIHVSAGCKHPKKTMKTLSVIYLRVRLPYNWLKIHRYR